MLTEVERNRERITVNKDESEQNWVFEQVDPEVWMTYPPDKQAAYHAWLAGDIFGDDAESEPERKRKQNGGKREGPTIQSLIEQDFIDGGLSGRVNIDSFNTAHGKQITSHAIRSALKHHIGPHGKFKTRTRDGVIEYWIERDESAISSDERIQADRERVIGIIRALTGEDLDVRIEPITARVLIQAIKLNVKPGDIK